MDKQNKSTKYKVWFYNLNVRELTVLSSVFPCEHFEYEYINDNKLNKMSRLKIFDRPDILICDINTDLTSSVKDSLCDSCCGLARVSFEPFCEYNGNAFELGDDLLYYPVKRNGVFEEDCCTKTDYAFKKLVDICQISNIEKIQKWLSEITNLDLRSELGCDIENVSDDVIKDYLFRISRKINDYISLKDYYTAGHCKRVAMYSEALAIALGMDNDQVEDLILAANLHDIGKVALPDALITKTSRLDDFEYDLMKTHVDLGLLILSENLFNNIKSSIRAHHEKYDGTGYPDGLKGDEIPLFAQIIAIADSFDAMTSQRTYNKVKTPEEAFIDLLQHTKSVDEGGRGIHYNSELVNKFIDVISNSNTIMNMLNNNDIESDKELKKSAGR